MPSPFPGMHPFLEAQRWTSFHTRFITELSDVLVAQLGPRYEADPEERIYIESVFDEPITYRADVAVSSGHDIAPHATATLETEIEPTAYTFPMAQEQFEPFVIIRQSRNHEVVTVIELLSPGNKRQGSDGRKAYLAKRTEIMRSRVHLVEIDLLVGGLRLPTQPALKSETDYCVFVSRAGKRPRGVVYEWTLRQKLPRIAIPLAGEDPDSILNLQAAFENVFARAGYGHSLDYDERLHLPIREPDVPWMLERLSSKL